MVQILKNILIILCLKYFKTQNYIEIIIMHDKSIKLISFTKLKSTNLLTFINKIVMHKPNLKTQSN